MGLLHERPCITKIHNLSYNPSRFPVFFVETQCTKREEEYGNDYKTSPN
jgi:hypothetical protein